MLTVFIFRHDSVTDSEKSEEFLNDQIPASNVIQQISVVKLKRRFGHRVGREVDLSPHLNKVLKNKNLRTVDLGTFINGGGKAFFDTMTILGCKAQGNCCQIMSKLSNVISE